MNFEEFCLDFLLRNAVAFIDLVLLRFPPTPAKLKKKQVVVDLMLSLNRNLSENEEAGLTMVWPSEKGRQL